MEVVWVRNGVTIKKYFVAVRGAALQSTLALPIVSRRFWKNEFSVIIANKVIEVGL